MGSTLKRALQFSLGQNRSLEVLKDMGGYEQLTPSGSLNFLSASEPCFFNQPFFLPGEVIGQSSMVAMLVLEPSATAGTTATISMQVCPNFPVPPGVNQTTPDSGGGSLNETDGNAWAEGISYADATDTNIFGTIAEVSGLTYSDANLFPQMFIFTFQDIDKPKLTLFPFTLQFSFTNIINPGGSVASIIHSGLFWSVKK